MPDSVVNWLLVKRVKVLEAWQNYGNGNSKTKGDVWPELAQAAQEDEIIGGDAWITGLDSKVLATKFNLKWDGARSIFKDYKAACNRSGTEKAKVPRVLSMCKVFLDWCYTQPDLNLDGLSVSVFWLLIISIVHLSHSVTLCILASGGTRRGR